MLLCLSEDTVSYILAFGSLAVPGISVNGVARQFRKGFRTPTAVGKES